MDQLIEQIKHLFSLLFLHPKSTTAMAALLLVVVLIALYVNRRRDETGRVSFVDRSRTGVLGARIYQTEDGYRTKGWLLPLYAPEKKLLLHVKIVLPKGRYDVKACWKAKSGGRIGRELFEPQPIDKEKSVGVSEVGRFEISSPAAVEFRLQASGKGLQIVSPDEESIEPDPEKPPFPLAIADSSIGKAAGAFEKARKTNLWELSLVDPRAIAGVEGEKEDLRRKLDGLTVKNRQLESHLDQTVGRLRAMQKSAKAKSETPESADARDPVGKT